MSKIQLGLILIFSGVIMHMLGRILMPANPIEINLLTLTLTGLLMIASLVVFILGVYKCVVGLLAKYRSPNTD